VWYRRFGGTVLATRLEAGLAGPLGDSLDLLPNKRFFAGGANSMRGARRRMLGPRDEEGAPLGGESLLLATAELRFRVKGHVGAVLFVDAGNVWRFADDTSINTLEAAAGPGLMVRTPVGPVRLDTAFNMTSRPADEPGIVLHISVGHPF
jgi:translocation and assembly module TamA